MELPDSFYTQDKDGCKGFTEWGFLSTTSDRAMAMEVRLSPSTSSVKALIQQPRTYYRFGQIAIFFS